MFARRNLLSLVVAVVISLSGWGQAMADHDQWAELIFDQSHYKLAGDVRVSAVDRLAAKITIGNYSKDSNDLLSAWVMGDFTGGHGVTDLVEGVDDNRYRFSTLYTRFPNQISKPYSITAADIGGAYASVRMLGDFDDAGTHLLALSADDHLFIDGSDIGAMGAAPWPRQHGVTFSGTSTAAMFYVPTPTGYSVYRTTGPTLRNSTAIIMKSFVVWDDKLIGINSAGQLYYAITATAAADTTFTSYGTGGKLDPAFVPLRLEVFYNRSGEPAVHVITDQNVWVFDPATPRLYQIPDFGSVHPYFGFASAVWHGELYVSAGMDILAYNGSVVRNVGLSRDQGIPYIYQNYVQDLEPGQNSLYAGVVGASQRYSIHEWSGIGWHCIYADPTTSRNLTSLALHQSGTTVYRLYWGRFWDGAYYYQNLPIAFTNPRAAIEDAGITMGDFTNTSGGVYNTLYYLETGKFNANMAGYNKIASACELDVRAIDGTNETITLKYRIDNETSWTTLYHTDGAPPSGTTVTTTGHHLFEFGTYANGIYPGVKFEEIEFRIEVQDALPNPYTQTTSCIIESLVFSFLPIKNPSLAWTAVVDCTNTHNKLSPEQLVAKLTTLRTQGTFFAMVHQGTTYRVRLAGFDGSEKAGHDFRGTYTLSLVEIRPNLGIS